MASSERGITVLNRHTNKEGSESEIKLFKPYMYIKIIKKICNHI